MGEGPACTGPGLTAWTAGLTGPGFAADLCCSSACADIAKAASAETNGKNILERLEMFILNHPAIGLPPQHFAKLSLILASLNYIVLLQIRKFERLSRHSASYGHKRRSEFSGMSLDWAAPMPGRQRP
jgi:hypothetical protein